MKWSEIAPREPALAAVAHDRLIAPGVLLVGTIRRDGSPRISGVEPLVMDGRLWLSMMQASTKAHDLHRDPRILLHSIVTGPEGTPEVKIRGSVREETGRQVQERYAAADVRRLLSPSPDA
jgi:Pyridoxamine 5'-phosphate oxidase